MKTKIHRLLLTGILAAMAHQCATAGIMIVQNLTNDAEAVYGLADSSGALLSGSLTDNVRSGYFDVSDSELLDLWNAGDLVSLEASFVQFGPRTSMQDFDAGFDGIFQDAPATFADPFDGKNVYLYISNASNFTDVASEYLIYKFDGKFTEDPFDGEFLLGTTPGSLLVGGFDNFQFDYELGGGALPAFNTVAAVPEPEVFGFLLSVVTLGLVVVRRRRCRS